MALVAYSQSKPSSFRASSTWSAYGTQSSGGSGVSSHTYPTGDSLSGFRNDVRLSQIANGENATTPLSAQSKQVLSLTPCVYTWRNKFRDDWLTGVFEEFVVFGSPNTDLLSTADNIARTKAYNQLSSNFKGLQVLGELGETLRMIRSPALGLRKGIDEYLLGARKIRSTFSRTKRLKNYRDAIAELWLEYSFGWKPLVADITAGYDAFRDRTDNPEWQSFRALGQASGATTGFSGNDSYGTPLAMHKETQYLWEAGVLYIGKAQIKVTAQAGRLASTNLPDFIPAAWELAPWSFLIDYFVNIGSVLECWATAQNYNISVSSRTKRNIVTATTSCSPEGYTPQLNDYSIRNTSVGICDTIVKTVERDIPQLTLPSLQVSAKFTAPRALNIAALIALRKSDSRFSPID